VKTYDVRIWKIGTNAAGSPVVRWRTARRSHSRSFATKALADSFRSELVSAARAGEWFDVGSGLPARLLDPQTGGPSWYEHAVAYAAMKWRTAAPNTRVSIAEGLATVTPALTQPKRGRPEAKVLQRALYGWAFNPGRSGAPQPKDAAEALRWVRGASVPVRALADDLDLVRRGLDALAHRLDGRPAAATTFRRKRAVFYNALGYAVERRLLPANPLSLVQWTMPKAEVEVDRRVVASPEQVDQLLRAVAARGRRGRHLAAFYGCLYYAAARPAEATALLRPECELPVSGWGALHLTGSAPPVGAAWTDSGLVHERRELKHRARHAVRTVPIPPVYVRMLRAHLEEFGTADDGRVFRSATGGHLQGWEFNPEWRAARQAALTPEQVDSPLAGRPYDLRHAGVSLWLRSGVDVTEIARRAGHTVDVLLRIYAGIIHGTEQEANSRIERALSTRREVPGGGATRGTCRECGRLGDVGSSEVCHECQTGPRDDDSPADEDDEG